MQPVARLFKALHAGRSHVETVPLNTRCPRGSHGVKQGGHERLSPPHCDLVQGPEAVGRLVFKQMTILFKPARILFNRLPITSAIRAARVMSTAGVSTAVTCAFNPLRILFNRAASSDAPRIGSSPTSNPRPGFVIP